MTRLSTRLRAVALAASAIGFAGHALADEFLDAAAKRVQASTAPADKWDGPTSGPKAAAAKTIVFVAGDLKNGGILGASQGVEDAGKTLGWTVRTIDGKGQ